MRFGWAFGASCELDTILGSSIPWDENNLSVSHASSYREKDNRHKRRKEGMQDKSMLHNMCDQNLQIEIRARNSPDVTPAGACHAHPHYLMVYRISNPLAL